MFTGKVTPPDKEQAPSRQTAGSVTGELYPTWLKLAKDSWQMSTSYFDVNWRKQFEKNELHWQSRHQTGSKYLTDAYKYRSKHFRPKTRSASRQAEAALMAAFFSNQDALDVEARDRQNPVFRANADLIKSLVNYRLDTSIKWYKTCIGAFQNAWKDGWVVSKNYWQYEEADEDVLVPLTYNGAIVLDPNGRPFLVDSKQRVVVKDQPCIELKPPENIRIHPAANWIDPINMSPFLINMEPMYVIDVQARMRRADQKTGQPKWRMLSDGQILSAVRHTYDSTRLTREKGHEDRMGITMPKTLNPYEVVWVHENFMRVGNMEVVYWTLGTDYVLSKPVPVRQVYRHCRRGERPFSEGTCVIETHKVISSGVGQLAENVQKELNENANQRADNVKLVMNKRYLVRRGSQVDTKSLNRNVAGGITFVGSIMGTKGPDVYPMEFHDVTASAYSEQDRLNVEFDEVTGTFGTSTIQTNRKLGETVGGLSMLKGTANLLTEYDLRTFSETWGESTMRQMVRMEQVYESDEVILALAARDAQVFQKYGINDLTDILIEQELMTRINLGMGATDPIMKVQLFMLGVRTVLEVLTTAPQGTLDVMEIAKEVFGRLGYKDGMRFFLQETGIDPEKMGMAQIINQLQAVVEELQKELDDRSADRDNKLLQTRMKEAGQDRRKAADLRTRIVEKQMDLLNPTAGERYPVNTRRLAR